jgi:hypothetical protein
MMKRIEIMKNVEGWPGKEERKERGTRPKLIIYRQQRV